MNEIKLESRNNNESYLSRRGSLEENLSKIAYDDAYQTEGFAEKQEPIKSEKEKISITSSEIQEIAKDKLGTFGVQLVTVLKSLCEGDITIKQVTNKKGSAANKVAVTTYTLFFAALMYAATMLSWMQVAKVASVGVGAIVFLEMVFYGYNEKQYQTTNEYTLKSGNDLENENDPNEFESEPEPKKSGDVHLPHILSGMKVKLYEYCDVKKAIIIDIFEEKYKDLLKDKKVSNEIIKKIEDLSDFYNKGFKSCEELTDIEKNEKIFTNERKEYFKNHKKIMDMAMIIGNSERRFALEEINFKEFDELRDACALLIEGTGRKQISGINTYQRIYISPEDLPSLKENVESLI